MSIGRGIYGHIRTHGSIGGRLVPFDRLEPEVPKGDRTWRKNEHEGRRRHDHKGNGKEDAR